MPAITLGFSEIERQLRSIRRRRNLVTLQQALYLWGSLTLLAAALLVVLAVRGHAIVFSVALWAVLGVIGLGLAATGRHIWGRWLSAAATVHWTDRGAHLEDRLSTLVAHHAQPQTTRLAGLIVTQLFTLRHRFQPKALVPRAVPRSVYLLAAALAALVTTTFLERPPAEPRRFPLASRPQPSASADGLPAPGAVVSADPSARGDGSLAESETLLEGGAAPSGERQPAHKQRKGERGTERSRRGQQSAARGAAGADARGGQSDQLVDDDIDPSDERGQDQLAGRVQDMIRQALGAKADTERAALQPAPGAGAGRQLAQRGQRPGEGAGHRDENASGESAKGTEEGKDPGNNPRQAKSDQPQTGEGSRGGQQASGKGGGERGPGGLYGEDSLLAQPREALKTFQLNLSLLAQGARSTTEPQKRGDSKVTDLGVADPLPSTIRLSSHDRVDEAVLRTEVPPEHEGIVRRIFSHADEE
jgi:hypothetical protein